VGAGCKQNLTILLLSLFEPRNVQSVATHNTAFTHYLKYLSTAKYRNVVLLWSMVGYSLSVALSVGAADCVSWRRRKSKSCSV